LIYEATGLFLTIRGKALEGGTEGDVVSVMNLQSKRTVSGVVTGRGQVSISTPRLLPAASDTTSSLAPAASSPAPVAVATNATSPVSPKAE
jgi:flagella basal body P-ring formation protein FlgA